MKQIVLISCASKKVNFKTKAKDLYISSFFKKKLKYATSLNPDKIFILSGKYGLLKLDEVIEPYDKNLNKMRSEKIKKWANSVLKQLNKSVDLENDKFIFLAGNKYIKFLLPSIKHKEIPMKGLRIGKQLQWLSKRINKE